MFQRRWKFSDFANTIRQYFVCKRDCQHQRTNKLYLYSNGFAWKCVTPFGISWSKLSSNSIDWLQSSSLPYFSHGRLKVFIDGLQNLNVSKWGNQWEALFFGITALSSTFSWQTDLSCAKFCWSSQQRLTRSSHWPLIKIQCKKSTNKSVQDLTRYWFAPQIEI